MQYKLIDAFSNITPPQMTPIDQINRYGSQYLNNVGEMSVGYGTQAMHADQQGVWLGANRFTDAPFRVDMQGKMTMTSQDGRAIKISAPDNTFLVNDGDEDIILIGYQAGGF